MSNSWKRTGVAPEGFQIIPPDGGWGWMVLAGCSINAFCYMVPFLLFFIIMDYLMEEFEVDTVTVTWSMTLPGFLAGVCAPLASIICTLSSGRKCVMLGGILLSVTLIVSSVARNIWQMTAVFSIFGGFGYICIYIPLTGILAEYFKDHFGVAVGVYYSAFSIGKLTLPPLIEYLLREYSWRECMAMFGALTLNSCVGAATFQPSRWHLKLKPLDPNITFIQLKGTDDQPVHLTENDDCNRSEQSKANCFKKLSRVLDLQLLKNPIFYLVSITYCLHMNVAVLSSGYMYVFGVEAGLSPVEAAWMLSVDAIGEGLGMITGPMAVKFFKLPIQTTFLVYSVATASMYTVLALMKSLWSLYLFVSLSDFFFGCAISLLPTVILEELGAHKLVSTIAYAEFILGFTALVLGPVTGWLRDFTGTYAACYLQFAFLLGLIALIWSLRMALQRFHKQDKGSKDKT